MSNLYLYRRLDGQQTYIANAILAKEPIRNYRRSENQSEPIEIQINYSTSPELIQQLEDKMNDFYKLKPAVYRFPIIIGFKEVYESNKLTIVVPILFKKNWQDWKSKSIARNDMMKYLHKVMFELKIEYHYLNTTVKMLQ